MIQKNNSTFTPKQNSKFECAICGCRDFIFLFKAPNYFSFSPDPFNFIKCSRCGQVSVNLSFCKEYIHPPVSYKKSGRTDIWYFLHPNRTNIVRKFKKGGRILDIGCGLGEFLFDMKKLRWEVFGNDVVADACAYATKEFALKNIYNKDLILLDFPDKFFDVITLWHVFEHIGRPLESLRKINKILKDDGILIIESPNFGSPQRNFFKEKWFPLGIPNHICHYSPKSLEGVLERTRLKIVRKDYFVNQRIDFIALKRSMLRFLHLEYPPDAKGTNEASILAWLKKYKLIFIFELICFPISLFLALINCGSCFRVYCKKIQSTERELKHRAKSILIKKAKVALGIITGKTITGPIEVSIDITNKCGLGCITCWFYSSLNKDRIDQTWANKEMDFDLFKSIVDQSKDLDVKKIMVGAEGDPFLHPQIIKMLEYAKKSNFIVDTATCGVFFNEENLKTLIDIGIDSINVSILAATPEVYQKMHPNQKKDLFERIKQSLISLSISKRKNRTKFPYVRLVYVVCKLNYSEVDEIIDFAKMTGAQAVAFKRLDITPFTKELLLDEAQIEELKKKLDIAKQKARANIIEANVEEFHRFQLLGLTSGDYTSEFYSQVPCYVGWTYSRVLCDGSVLPCCGCCDYILGDLNKQTFKDIWNSQKYKEFRKESINILKDKSIFKKCTCHSCVHFTSNLGIYQNLHPIRIKKIC
ncbi:MAG: methyltransferase domain-containing protein [Candidatus Omnitrophica bacterium]|nr:methyltransferase domain-containing protein [Candidatus Omnitrophota bacterium]